MYNALCKDKVFKLKTKIGIVNSVGIARLTKINRGGVNRERFMVNFA